jgi:hypothetical protein
MNEIIPIGTTRLKPYSRNNNLPIYADTTNNTTFVGVNVSAVRASNLSMVQRYSLETKYAFRPDLISYKYYRTPLLGWYICLANEIVDPFDPDTGLYPGRQIIIPSLDYVFQQVV